MRAEPIRKVAVAVLAVVAAALLVAGLVLGRGSRDAWSNAVLSSSTGVFVLLLGTLATPYLRRAVQRETALIREDIRQQAEQIEERVVRLEELADRQQEQRSSLLGEIEADAQRISTDLSRESVLDALQTAKRLNLLHLGHFRLRASTELDGPELFLAGAEYDDSSELYLSFVPIGFPRILMSGVPVDDESVVAWTPGIPPDEIMRRLLEKLMADNSAHYQSFDFARALHALQRSITLTADARQQPRNSPRRLQGRLITLINDEWVLTDHGLESVDDAAVVKAPVIEFAEMECPEGHDPDAWAEAVAYFRKWISEARQIQEEYRRATETPF